VIELQADKEYNEWNGIIGKFGNVGKLLRRQLVYDPLRGVPSAPSETIKEPNAWATDDNYVDFMTILYDRWEPVAKYYEQMCKNYVYALR
jgi:hypothetical protein